MDSMSAIGASINRRIRAFEVSHSLRNVDSPSSDLLETTRHVEANIKESRRLRRDRERLINDEERIWIDGVIDDTEKALCAASQFIEPREGESINKHSINISSKAMAAFKGTSKIRDKHARLNVCHQSLTAVIACLHQKDPMAAVSIQTERKAVQPPPYDAQLEQLFNWRNRRKRGKSSISVNKNTGIGLGQVEVAASNLAQNHQYQFESIRARAPSIGSNPRDATTHLTPSPIPRSASAISESRGDLLSLPPLFGPWEESGGRPMSATLGVPPCPTFVSRPRSASLPLCENGQPTSRAPVPYPMSPSDYSIKFLSESRANPGLSPLRKSVSNFHDALSRSENDISFSNISNMTSATQSQSSANSQFKVSDKEEVNSALVGGPDRSLDGADGLQLVEELQPRYIPCRLPRLSISTSTLCLSPPLRPVSSSSARDSFGQDYTRDYANTEPSDKQPTADSNMSSLNIEDGLIGGQSMQSRLTADMTGVNQPPEMIAGSGRWGRGRGSRSWLMFHAQKSYLDLPRQGDESYEPHDLSPHQTVAEGKRAS